jgi:NADH-quinone oxidoreductase subunit A
VTAWPLGVYGALVLVVVAIMLIGSHLLGPRHHERHTGIPYESGIRPWGSARLRVGVRFYRIAVFFVVFDLEAVFLFAWAIAARDLGWPGYVEMAIFVAVLLAGLAYLARSGALDVGGATGGSRA